MSRDNFQRYKYIKVKNTEQQEDNNTFCLCGCFARFIWKNNLDVVRAESGLSNEQYDDLKRAFDTFDANHDGYIDIHEIKMIMTKYGDAISTEDLNSIVKEVTKEKKSKISLSDFIKLMSDGVDTVEDLQQIFVQVDENNDGYISQDELKSLSRKFSKYIHDDDVIRMMEEADLNGDGLIDLHEFKTIMKENSKS